MIQFQVTKDFGNPLLPVSKARSELYLSGSSLVVVAEGMIMAY